MSFTCRVHGYTEVSQSRLVDVPTKSKEKEHATNRKSKRQTQEDTFTFVCFSVCFCWLFLLCFGCCLHVFVVFVVLVDLVVCLLMSLFCCLFRFVSIECVFVLWIHYLGIGVFSCIF